MSLEPRSRPKEIDFARLVEKYGSEEKCRAYLEALRWPDGVACPRDGKKAVRIGQTGSWDCSCGYQFTVRVGTVLQDSKLPLWKWFVATLLMVESRKGISANQVRRMTGTSYKTAWFLAHRIREAMSQSTSTEPLSGTVEVDETYVGGKPRNRGPRGSYDPRSKTVVLGAVERGGRIRLRVERGGTNRANLTNFVRENVDGNTVHLYTDGSPAYPDMTDANTTHERVNHAAKEWVRGDVHTNTIEGVWSLFKRSIVGSYHHLSVKHMDKYLDEVEWRFNNRTNRFLFRDTLKALISAQTLTYEALKNRTN